MDAKGIAAVLTAVAWPVTITILMFSFRAPLSHLFESLAVKTFKIKVLGVEIELTPEQAKNTLSELLKDILESTTALPEEEVSLFRAIRSAGGGRTVLELMPKFVRESQEHRQLRNLRNRKLIRPLEGKKWENFKHPVVTHFGELICRIEPKVCDNV